MNAKTVEAPDALDKRELLKVLTAFRRGDFSTRLSTASNAVGKEGRINQRVSVGSHGGGWAACVDSINNLIGDVVQPSTEVARVIGAVAKGELSQTMKLEVDG